MIYSVHVRPEAEIDIEDATFWYQKQLHGLGNKFLIELERSIQNISENPYGYQKIHKNIRRILLKKFPFGVYYSIEDNLIIIIAVMHGSRNPKQWQKRQ